jgi:hypothetical protein
MLASGNDLRDIIAVTQHFVVQRRAADVIDRQNEVGSSQAVFAI